MKVEFLMRAPPGVDSHGEPHNPIEYVQISGLGSDTVCRTATDQDRRLFRSEYQAFRASRPVPQKAPTPENVKPLAVRPRPKG